MEFAATLLQDQQLTASISSLYKKDSIYGLVAANVAAKGSPLHFYIINKTF